MALTDAFQAVLQANMDKQRLALEQADRERLDRLIGIQAAARLENTRADLMPSEVASEIALRASQAGLNNANAQYVGPLAQSLIGMQGAVAGRERANTAEIESGTRALNLFNSRTAPAAAPVTTTSPVTRGVDPWTQTPFQGYQPPAMKPKKVSYGGMMSSSSSPYGLMRLGWLG